MFLRDHDKVSTHWSQGYMLALCKWTVEMVYRGVLVLDALVGWIEERNISRIDLAVVFLYYLMESHNWVACRRWVIIGFGRRASVVGSLHEAWSFMHSRTQEGKLINVDSIGLFAAVTSGIPLVGSRINIVGNRGRGEVARSTVCNFDISKDGGNRDFEIDRNKICGSVVFGELFQFRVECLHP